MYWGCYINTLRQIPIKPWVIEKQYPSSKHVLFSTNILYSILPGATLEDQQQQFLTLSPADSVMCGNLSKCLGLCGWVTVWVTEPLVSWRQLPW